MKKELLGIGCFIVTLAVAQSEIALSVTGFENRGPQGSIGDIRGIWPGSAFGIGISKDEGRYRVDAITLEHYSYAPGTQPHFQLEIYGESIFSSPPWGEPGDAPLGEFGSPEVLPEETRWPGSTSFVRYQAASEIILDESSNFYIVASTPIDAPAVGYGNAMLFHQRLPTTTGLPGWQLSNPISGYYYAGQWQWWTFVPAYINFRIEVTPLVDHATPVAIPESGAYLVGLSLLPVGFFWLRCRRTSRDFQAH